MKHPWLLPIVLAALLALPGCETPPARVPRETRTVTLASGKVTPVKMETVTAVRFVLPEARAGYEWVLTSNNRRVIDQMGPLAPDPALPQRAPDITFYALEPGRSIVRFFMIPIGDLVATPVATCVATVEVED